MSRFFLKGKLAMRVLPLKDKSSLNKLLQIWYWIKQQTTFSVCVLMPLLLVAGYLILIKTPEYESTANILIHNYENNNVLLNGTNLLFQKARKKQQSQIPQSSTTFLIKKYLHSETMLIALQKSTNVKNHYQEDWIDRISRLKKKANQKEFLNYFIKKINFSFDVKTGELSMALRAFSPEKAQELLNLIVNQTIEFLNQLEQSTAKDQIIFLQEKLSETRKKLIRAELTLQQASQQKNKYLPRQEIERRKLELKFTQAEYEAAQQAYVFWIMSLKRNSLVKTASPNLPDYYSYPRIPYDLFNLLAILSVFFILTKMILVVVKEHID